jgi:CTP synthase
MHEEGLDDVVLQKLKLNADSVPELGPWKEFLDRLAHPEDTVKIGLIGKYVELQDSYKSILEAFIHAGARNRVEVEVVSIHSETLEVSEVEAKLKGLNGLLVAPGFGKRGLEGKIKAVQYAREHNVPFFGICLGMQMAIVEYARNVLGIENANSIEVDEHTSSPLISLMEEQKKITHLGGTMRLGSWECELTEGSKASEIYSNAKIINERHRHRFEVNNQYEKQLEEAGLKATGRNKETQLVEIVELENHPWYVGVQYHPEYKSTVANPHPLFVSFIAAALSHKKNQL